MNMLLAPMSLSLLALLLPAGPSAAADSTGGDWYDRASQDVLVWPECESPKSPKSKTRIRVPLVSPYAVEAEMKEEYIELVDVRSDYEFEEMHLAGARSVPYDQVEFASFKKGHSIVLYCGSCCCREIPAAAGALFKRGFDEISVLRGGLQEIGNLVLWQASEAAAPKQFVHLACGPARSEIEAFEEKLALERVPPVHFEFDKAELRTYSKKTLDEAARLLKKFDSIKLKINGHTDGLGGRDYNMDLSRRRAGAVAAYLSSRGVEEGRLQSEGFGDAKPVASNETEDGRAENRRVEFVWLEADAPF